MIPPLIGNVMQGCDGSVLALVLKSHGVPIVQADVDAISVTIINLTTGAAVAGWSGQSVTASAVIYDTLQTAAVDPDWTLSAGYNFRHDLPGTAFPAPSPSANVRFAYDCTITLNSGQKLPVKFLIDSDRFTVG
jgi:hypothetical protein